MGGETCAAGWGGGVSCGQAELGQSIQVGSPGGDGQLHGLLFRGGDRAMETVLGSPEVPSPHGGEIGLKEREVWEGL